MDEELLKELCAWLDDIELPEVDLSVIDELRSPVVKRRTSKTNSSLKSMTYTE